MQRESSVSGELLAKDEEDSGKPERSTFWQRLTYPYKNLYYHMSTDQAFADHIAQRVDRFMALFRFFAYTLTSILIFVVNKNRYGDLNSWN